MKKVDRDTTDKNISLAVQAGRYTIVKHYMKVYWYTVSLIIDRMHKVESFSVELCGVVWKNCSQKI